MVNSRNPGGFSAADVSAAKGAERDCAPTAHVAEAPAPGVPIGEELVRAGLADRARDLAAIGAVGTDLACDLPFVHRVSPERRRAAESSRKWAQHMGLASDTASLRRHHEIYDFSSWAALSCPDATGGDLDLCSDLATWFGYFEDQLDEIADDARKLSAFITMTTGVITGSIPKNSHPVALALADLWKRQRVGMSPSWQSRACRNWADYLGVHTKEAAVRRGEYTYAGLEDYLQVRDLSGVVWVILDFTERAGHYEVPEAVMDHPVIRRMRLAAVRVVDLAQDLLSADRELACGDPNNAVAVVTAQGATREEAIAEVQALVRNYTDSFLEDEARLPRMCDALAIPSQDRGPVYRHSADMRTIMRGTQDFCLGSARYSQ